METLKSTITYKLPSMFSKQRFSQHGSLRGTVELVEFDRATDKRVENDMSAAGRQQVKTPTLYTFTLICISSFSLTPRTPLTPTCPQCFRRAAARSTPSAAAEFLHLCDRKLEKIHHAIKRQRKKSVKQTIFTRFKRNTQHTKTHIHHKRIQ